MAARVRFPPMKLRPMQGLALYWPIAAAVLLILVVAVAVGRPWLASYRKRRAALAVKQFRLQREQLEAHFFHRAGSLGKPRGLRWLECVSGGLRYRQPTRTS